MRHRGQKLLEKYPFQIDLSKLVFELETVEKETIAVSTGTFSREYLHSGVR